MQPFHIPTLSLNTDTTDFNHRVLMRPNCEGPNVPSSSAYSPAVMLQLPYSFVSPPHGMNPQYWQYLQSISAVPTQSNWAEHRPMSLPYGQFVSPVSPSRVSPNALHSHGMHGALVDTSAATYGSSLISNIPEPLSLSQNDVNLSSTLHPSSVSLKHADLPGVLVKSTEEMILPPPGYGVFPEYPTLPIFGESQYFPMKENVYGEAASANHQIHQNLQPTPITQHQLLMLQGSPHVLPSHSQHTSAMTFSSPSAERIAKNGGRHGRNRRSKSKKEEEGRPNSSDSSSSRARSQVGNSEVVKRQSIQKNIPNRLPKNLKNWGSSGHGAERTRSKIEGEEVADEDIEHTTFKTEICRSHLSSQKCDYGDKCQFAHGVEELRAREFDCRYKTELCKCFFLQGADACPFGSRCKFIHEEYRIRAGEHEFWLVSPRENLIRVEIVDPNNRERLQLLQQLVDYAPLLSSEDTSAPPSNTVGTIENASNTEFQGGTPEQLENKEIDTTLKMRKQQRSQSTPNILGTSTSSTKGMLQTAALSQNEKQIVEKGPRILRSNSVGCWVESMCLAQNLQLQVKIPAHNEEATISPPESLRKILQADFSKEIDSGSSGENDGSASSRVISFFCTRSSTKTSVQAPSPRSLGFAHPVELPEFTLAEAAKGATRLNGKQSKMVSSTHNISPITTSASSLHNRTFATFPLSQRSKISELLGSLVISGKEGMKEEATQPLNTCGSEDSPQPERTSISPPREENEMEHNDSCTTKCTGGSSSGVAGCGASNVMRQKRKRLSRRTLSNTGKHEGRFDLVRDGFGFQEEIPINQTSVADSHRKSSDGGGLGSDKSSPHADLCHSEDHVAMNAETKQSSNSGSDLSDISCSPEERRIMQIHELAFDGGTLCGVPATNSQAGQN